MHYVLLIKHNHHHIYRKFHKLKKTYSITSDLDQVKIVYFVFFLRRINFFESILFFCIYVHF